MRRSIIAMTILLAAANSKAFAQEGRRLEADDLRKRLEVTGEIFVLDATGKKLESVAATKNVWRGSGSSPIASNWGNRGDEYGAIYLRHVWTVQPDGTIKVLVEEYANQADDPARTMKNLLKREEITLENFAPISWKVLNNKQKHVVARLTPSLREQRTVRLLSDMPISGTSVSMADNQGFLWTDGASFDGDYVSLKTHRGTLAMSFKKFSGAEEIGEAWGHEIAVSLPGDLRVKLRSETAFLPEKVGARVFGIYYPDRKAAHPRSTHVSTSSTEENFLKNLKP